MHIEIIAELGQGFEGRPEQARLLIKAASTAGADAAKFQLVYADELATPDYKYYSLFKSLEMDDTVWKELAAFASDLGISVYLDIFGTRGLHLAERIGINTVKLHATDIANVGLLEEVSASSIHRVLLGAGGAFMNELENAIDILSSKELVVLLGFQGYPTPNEGNQIARISLLAKRFQQTHPRVIVGFADHAPTDSPMKFCLPSTAIGAGARVLEKHLTLGQVMKLEDYESALNPDEFAMFCQVTRDCAQAFGESSDCSDFGMSEAEHGYRKMIRRHVVTCHDLVAGVRLEAKDLLLKRSSKEDVLTDLTLVYGKTLKHDLKKNTPISQQEIA